MNVYLFQRSGLLALFVFIGAEIASVQAGDQPQWGQAWSRNMVSAETGLPTVFDPKTGRNMKWSVALGSETHSTPIVAAGRVYIGTNNDSPRDQRHQGDRGVLMCFAEEDGKLLWQLITPKRSEDPYFDWPKSGISSTVTVQGERVYLVSNRGEVLCLDPHGMANGNQGFTNEAQQMTPAGEPLVAATNTDADILWRFDLVAGAGIWSHDAAHTSILIEGDYLYLNTGTGVDNSHRRIRTPEAPSLVVLEKNTGRYVARDNEKMSPRIFHCTWSSPSLGKVDGNPLLFFAGGNGIVYAFQTVPARKSDAPLFHLEKAWEFDCDPSAPKENVHLYNSNRREGPSNIFGMPVFHRGRLYFTSGGDLWWGKNEARLQCIDANGRGNVTSNALRWTYPLERHVLSTPAIEGDLLFVADCGRNVHCLDAGSGKSYWVHETKGEYWSSPLIADGKVFIGSRRGDFWVFAAAKEKKILHTTEFGRPISATATAANGVLYVATMDRLYALKEGVAAPNP